MMVPSVKLNLTPPPEPPTHSTEAVDGHFEKWLASSHARSADHSAPRVEHKTRTADRDPVKSAAPRDDREPADPAEQTTHDARSRPDAADRSNHRPTDHRSEASADAETGAGGQAPVERSSSKSASPDASTDDKSPDSTDPQTQAVETSDSPVAAEAVAAEMLAQSSAQTLTRSTQTANDSQPGAAASAPPPNTTDATPQSSTSSAGQNQMSAAMLSSGAPQNAPAHPAGAVAKQTDPVPTPIVPSSRSSDSADASLVRVDESGRPAVRQAQSNLDASGQQANPSTAQQTAPQSSADTPSQQRQPADQQADQQTASQPSPKTEPAPRRIEMDGPGAQRSAADQKDAADSSPKGEFNKPAVSDGSTVRTAAPASSPAPATGALAIASTDPAPPAPSPAPASGAGSLMLGQMADEHTQQVMQRALSGVKGIADRQGGTIQLRLSPPDLGTLRIEVKIAAGAVRANFHASSLQAGQVLTENMTTLRQALENHGLRVEHLNVQTPLGSHTTSANQAHDQSQHHADPGADDGRSRGAFDQGGSTGDQGHRDQPEDQPPNRQTFSQQLVDLQV